MHCEAPHGLLKTTRIAAACTACSLHLDRIQTVFGCGNEVDMQTVLAIERHGPPHDAIPLGGEAPGGALF